jgi:hypothetical protein
MKHTRLAIITLSVLIGNLLTGNLPLQAATSVESAPAWSIPSVMALKRISSLSPHQSEPGYLSNLDCTLEDYHMTDSLTMQTGCFTETAFGQIDADSDVVIFNGTDEGLPLLPFSAHQLLAPWPKALDLVALDTVNTGGSYVSLYRNPLGALHDQRNLLGILSAKQLTVAPELPLKDSSGKPLVINGQSLAFSDNGSWAVMEVLGGSFVRMNLATLEMTPFAQIYSRQGSPALDSSSVTISSDGRYVAIENTYAAEFKVYDLNQCVAGRCSSYNYWPFIKNQVNQLLFISHVRFVNQGLLSFDASSKDPKAGGTYEVAPTAGIRSLIDYLGLGDSYSSGQGAFDYLSGSASADNQCHLSANSYPLLITHDLFTSVGGHSVACSGAVLHDIANTTDSYKGQVRGVANWRDLSLSQPALLASIMANYLPGYVAQQRFVGQYQPATITIGVGGNNMGFGNILERCIEPKTSLRPVANTCFATYEDRQELLTLVHKTGKSLQDVYRQLLRQDPGVNLYVVGYPQISVDNGNCALNVHFNTSELEFVDELVDQINSVIAGAATAAGAHYVDISQALAGHRMCETSRSNVAVNGLTAGNDNGIGDFNFLGNESYHPNALGQRLIEQAILKQTNNLRMTGSGPVAIPKPPGPAFAAKPKSGRPVTQLVPGKLTTNTKLQPGQPMSIAVDGVAYGLAPGTSLAVRLDGSQGSLLGTVSGGGSITVILPVIVAPGIHTIDVVGPNQAGQTTDVSQPIVVIPNGDRGQCFPAADSGQDADHDGIDDACDPLIGNPPNATSPPATVVVPPPAASAPLIVTSDSTVLAVSGPTSGVVASKPPSLSVSIAQQPRVLGASVQRSSKPALTTATFSPTIKLPNHGRSDRRPQGPNLRRLPWLWWLLGIIAVVTAWYIVHRKSVQA